MKKTRTYGPFVGMMNTVDRDVIPPDRVSGDSVNMIPDPLSGSMYNRSGSFNQNDTAIGLFESKFGSKCQQIFEFTSASLSDLQPTYAYINTSEDRGEGALGFYDGGAGVSRVLGQDMTSTHYPSAGSTTFIMMPLKIRTNAPNNSWEKRQYSRAADFIQRKLLTPGTRRSLEINGEVFLPNLSGTPARWNKQFNPTGSGTNVNRIRPWGNIPPVSELQFTWTAGAGKNWRNGVGNTSAVANQFFYTCMYRFADGSFSIPTIPRAPNAILTSGFNLCSNQPVSGGAVVGQDSVLVTNIPIGPDGTVARYLLRSPQVVGGVSPDPSDLRICGIINNNTQTSYTDTQGIDTSLSLVTDPQKVRFDHVWPWRGRHAFHFDERAAIGYIRPNPGAIVLCPKAIPQATFYPYVAYDQLADTLSIDGNLNTYAVRKSKTTGATSLVIAYAANYTLYDLSVYAVMNDLLDALNVDVGVGGTAGRWRGQLVPGSDGNNPTSALDITQVQVNCATTNTSPSITPVTAGHFADVLVGMRITGTGIPSGSSQTYVKTNTGTAITMCDVNGTAVNATATSGGVVLFFGWYGGDTTANAGEFRAYNSAFPGILYYSEAFLQTFETERHKSTIMFTSGEPGHARNAPNSFYAELKLTAQSSSGIFMGGAALSVDPRTLGIACFSKAVYRIENPRGGNTALDADIRLRLISGVKGCIASDSIVSGDGWVGFLSEDGYIVTDGVSYTCISKDVWNAGSSSVSLGEWDFEITRCRNGISQDTDQQHFHAMAFQGNLYITYRSGDQGTSAPDCMLVYDYSPGLAASGLPEITRGPNEAYGWSARCTNPVSGTFFPGSMTVCRKQNKVQYLFMDDKNGGATGDGNIYAFNILGFHLDTASAYPVSLHLKTDRCDSTLKKRAHVVRVISKKGAGTAVLKLYREKTRATSVNVLTFPTVASSLGIPDRKRRFVPILGKSPSDTLELAFTWTDINNANNFQVYQAEIDYEELVDTK